MLRLADTTLYVCVTGQPQEPVHPACGWRSNRVSGLADLCTWAPQSAFSHAAPQSAFSHAAERKRRSDCPVRDNRFC